MTTRTLEHRSLFLEYYKLATNPFAPNRARPLYQSHSSRQTVRQLDQLIAGHVQCLFLSGPAGVGKSTIVAYRLRELKDQSLSWLKPDVETRQGLLQRLLSDLGPGAINGSSAELKHILEVFLRHQTANGRRSYLVADGLESMSVPVLQELEWLSQLRLRNRPVIHLVMVTRNDDLVRGLMPDEGALLVRHMHQRLTGFTLEETRHYLTACLQSAGCHWEEELIPEDVTVDVQGFTRGIVADINALCFQALNALAATSTDPNRQPKVTRSLLKEAGTRLHLKFDPSPWQQVEEALTADAVHLTDPSRSAVEVARLLVSSGGAIVAEIRLGRPRMVLGRDESCDISLDSSYVSRYQNLFMETSDGWVLFDLNSTNGSFVNGRRVREHRLQDGDVIAVGRHQLRFVGVARRQGVPADVQTVPVRTGEGAGSTADTLAHRKGQFERSA